MSVGLERQHERNRLWCRQFVIDVYVSERSCIWCEETIRSVIFQAKCQMLNVRICCFSLLSMIVNEESFTVGLTKEESEDVTELWELYEAFFTTF